MKKMRKIIPAFAMLLVSAIMMSTASFAWFSMGTTATATGMEVKATASSSLVISHSADRAVFLAADQTIAWGAGGDQALPTGYDSLKPATHTGEGDYGLSIPDANATINAGTGVMTGTLTPVTTATGYFVDFVAYIATVGGAALQNQDLFANVHIPADITIAINNAVTIDFLTEYVTDGTTTTAETYKTKTDFKSVDAATYNGQTNTLSVNIGESITVPLLVADETDTTLSYIKVTMRVYFDGAMEETAGYTYVRNQNQTAIAASFSVEFEAKNHA